MQQKRPIPAWASATQTQVPFHRAGHSSQIHPEDTPYWTDQHTKKNPLALADDLDYPDEPRRSRTSSYYVPTTSKQQVIRQGNRELVIREGRPRRRIHWVFVFWIGAVMMLAVYLLYAWGSAWWSNHQLYATYGFPRTYQTDAVVGHSDSPAHPSHFIFLNLNAHVLIIELPGGDPNKAKMYSGPIIFDDNPTSVPVTGEFKDVGNGRMDMIVQIGHEQIIYLNDGKQFTPQQQ